MKVTVVGAGVWGTTLSSLLRENKHQVSFWENNEHLNCDIVVLAVPAQAMRKACLNVKKFFKKGAIINCAKGIEQKTHKLPFQIAGEVLGSEIEYFTLIGPSFAKEVQNKMPTLVNLGGFKKGSNSLEKMAGLFQTDYFRVKITHSVEALELASAFKNVYAIASGIADGLGFAANTRAKLISIALEELYKLNKCLGFKIERSAIPGIVGDLILTCNSSESRNFTLGGLLVTYPVSECLKQINSTVEGFYTASSVPYFSQKTKIKMPLAQFVYDAIRIDKPKALRQSFVKFVKNI